MATAVNSEGVRPCAVGAYGDGRLAEERPYGVGGVCTHWNETLHVGGDNVARPIAQRNSATVAYSPPRGDSCFTEEPDGTEAYRDDTGVVQVILGDGDGTRDVGECLSKGLLNEAKVVVSLPELIGRSRVAWL